MASRAIRLALSLACLIGAPALAGCPFPSGAPMHLGADYFKDFAPAYKPGMKWTYFNDEKPAADSPQEFSFEVTGVQGSQVTLKDAQGRSSTLSTQDVVYFGLTGQPGKLINDQTLYKVSGTEDVTVKAGRYPGATKLELVTPFGMSVGHVWVAKGVGVVKSTFEIAGAPPPPGAQTAPSFTQELETFSAP